MSRNILMLDTQYRSCNTEICASDKEGFNITIPPISKQNSIRCVNKQQAYIGRLKGRGESRLGVTGECLSLMQEREKREVAASAIIWLEKQLMSEQGRFQVPEKRCWNEISFCQSMLPAPLPPNSNQMSWRAALHSPGPSDGSRAGDETQARQESLANWTVRRNSVHTRLLSLRTPAVNVGHSQNYPQFF